MKTTAVLILLSLSFCIFSCNKGSNPPIASARKWIKKESYYILATKKYGDIIEWKYDDQKRVTELFAYSADSSQTPAIIDTIINYRFYYNANDSFPFKYVKVLKSHAITGLLTYSNKLLIQDTVISISPSDSMFSPGPGDCKHISYVPGQIISKSHLHRILYPSETSDTVFINNEDIISESLKEITKNFTTIGKFSYINGKIENPQFYQNITGIDGWYGRHVTENEMTEFNVNNQITKTSTTCQNVADSSGFLIKRTFYSNGTVLSIGTFEYY